MSHILSDAGLDLLFRDGHTHHVWTEKPVSEVVLRALYDLWQWGPTSFNCCPARVVFVTSKEAKDRLLPALSETNRAKTAAAPVTAIVGYDLRFFEFLPRLYPTNPNARDGFAANAQHAATTAFRNGSLQGAYMIVAARALGLDCGPMSGFDNAKVDAAFFSDGRVKSNFLCNLGYGDPVGVRPRNPRLEFDEACRIA